MIAWAAILGTVAGVELLTTYIGLSLGASEMNPIFANSRFETIVAAKFACIGFLLFVYSQCRARKLMVFTAALWGAAALYNIGVILWT